MEKKNFFEEVALACTDEASAVRQTMYLIMNSEITIQKKRELMVDSIVAKFMEKVDEPKLYELFNTKVGYKDRDFSQPAEKILIYELISASLSFPQKDKGFTLGPVGHYFREEDFSEIIVDYNLLAYHVKQMNETSFDGEQIIKTFRGPNTRGGEVIELYLTGGQCLLPEVKKNSKHKKH